MNVHSPHHSPSGEASPVWRSHSSLNQWLYLAGRGPRLPLSQGQAEEGTGSWHARPHHRPRLEPAARSHCRRKPFRRFDPKCIPGPSELTRESSQESKERRSGPLGTWLQQSRSPRAPAQAHVVHVPLIGWRNNSSDRSAGIFLDLLFPLP